MSVVISLFLRFYRVVAAVTDFLDFLPFPMRWILLLGLSWKLTAFVTCFATIVALESVLFLLMLAMCARVVQSMTAALPFLSLTIVELSSDYVTVSAIIIICALAAVCVRTIWLLSSALCLHSALLPAPKHGAVNWTWSCCISTFCLSISTMVASIAGLNLVL